MLIDLLYKYIINYWLNWDMREELARIIIYIYYLFILFIFEYCVEYRR